MKRFVLLFCLSALSILSFSQAETTHKVAKGETLYSIAKQYGMKPKQLMEANPKIGEDMKIKLGWDLVIPSTKGIVTEKKETTKPKEATTKASLTGTKTHTVEKGETFYAICKKYGVTAAEVKEWNGMSDVKIKLGQKLIVGKQTVAKEAMYESAKETKAEPPIVVEKKVETQKKEEPKAPKEEVKQPKENKEPRIEVPTDRPTPTKVESTEVKKADTPIPNADLKPEEYEKAFATNAATAGSIKKIRGAAMQLDENTSGNQNLCLYNLAPAGAIIKVTELMSHKVVYLKVVGRLSLPDAFKDIVMRVSQSAAKELGVTEDKFLVEVASY